MIKGMVWFEFMYLKKIKKNEKMISRYLLNKYPQNLLGSELKRLDEIKIFS